MKSSRRAALSLPDRDYYLEDSPRMQKIRDQYRDYVVTVFKLAGDSEDQAKTEAGQVLDIETALAKASLPRVELRDPDKRYHIETSGRALQRRSQFRLASVFRRRARPQSL